MDTNTYLFIKKNNNNLDHSYLGILSFYIPYLYKIQNITEFNNTFILV